MSSFDFMTWYGLAAPGGTPPEIVARLNAEVTKALNEPDVKERLAGLGVVGSPTSPADFATFMTSEARKVGEIIKVTGAKGE